MGQLISLHKIANEVVAKYDFLRTLNPEANLPVIRIDQPLSVVATIQPAAGGPPPDEGRDGHR